MSSAFVEEMTSKVQALGKGFSESSSTIDTSSITVKESIKGIRSVLYDLSVSSSEYAGTYRGVLEVFNNTSGSAANAQDAFNIVYNALKEVGVPLDELNKKLAQEFPSAAQATKSSVDSSIVEAQKTVSSSTGKMKTDAETNLAGVKKAAEDASGGVNTTTVTNWGNSASEVKKNLDKMKQTANLKLGEMQKTGIPAASIRAGIVYGWLPIGVAIQNNKPAKSLSGSRITYIVSPRKVYEVTGHVWRGKEALRKKNKAEEHIEE